MKQDLSRAVSHALRHEPWVYELELDTEGWVDINDLVLALRHEARWSSLTINDIEEMASTATKKRHEIRDGRIRALYGHSVPGRILKELATPPVKLFHGTSPVAAETILRTGLLPMKRQYVHLSVDRETALMVGMRKAQKPVILNVMADNAAAAGIDFYQGNDKVWLARRVPARFIGLDA
ncbi:MAG: RNA 2'-phosphotransferase [Propionibacteriaceae bacterium]|jgi:putative RNA 2'-phosphotransferase|nr:RNA 2'-phosphotransferase [Propionibacteriaceae bacterium]